MKRPFVLLVFFTLFLQNHTFAQVPFTCDGNPIIGLNHGLFFMHVDTDVGELTFDTILADSPHTFSVLGYNSQDNYLYSIVSENDLHVLLRIDREGSIAYLDTFHLNHDLWWKNLSTGDISIDGQFYFFVSPHINNSTMMLGTYDLSAPDTPLSFRSGITPTFSSADIAIHPLTGIIHTRTGISSLVNYLATLAPDSNEMNFTDYPLLQTTATLGWWLYFDPFANLWGPGWATFNKLNNETGLIEILFDTPQFYFKDVCSCPYITRMQLTTKRDSVFPCSEVEYTLLISNLYRDSLNELGLSVRFPTDFEITEIVYNPYEGHITSGIGDNVLFIEELNLFRGIDSIVLKVLIPEEGDGRYYSQAVLNNLDLSAANDTTTGIFSDYPRTTAAFDSTPIVITPLILEEEGYSVELCPDSTLVIGTDLPEEGLYFLWDNGDTTQQIAINQPGDYYLYLSTDCDTDTLLYEVTFDPPSIETERFYTVYYGDSLVLQPDYHSFSPIEQYQWFIHPEEFLRCDTCATATIIPFHDAEVRVEIRNQNGCYASSLTHLIINKDLFAPNVFSPNNDGINDYFYLQSKNTAIIKSIRIFDRWGGLVYQQSSTATNQLSQGWDGTKNGKKMASGVYIWEAALLYGNEVLRVSGDVMLMR